MDKSLTKAQFDKALDVDTVLILTAEMVNTLIEKLTKLREEGRFLPDLYYPGYEPADIYYNNQPRVELSNVYTRLQAYAVLTADNKSGIGTSLSLVTDKGIEDITDYDVW